MAVSISTERSHRDRKVGGYKEGGRLTSPSLDISIVEYDALQVYYQPGLFYVLNMDVRTSFMNASSVHEQYNGGRRRVCSSPGPHPIVQAKGTSLDRYRDVLIT